MYEITCFDSDGNTIDYFTQWDVNQTIAITLEDVDETYLLEPEIHFSNSSRKEALVVPANVINDNTTIVADVPNALLQEPFPLLVYVYLTDSDNASSQKTVLHSEIIVRKRQKPSDYNYVENIERLTAEKIKREIKAELADDVSSGRLFFDGISLIDVVTNRPYNIYVSDGKLMLESVDTSNVTCNSVTFVDRSDDDYKYKIYVSNGKIRFESAY